MYEREDSNGSPNQPSMSRPSPDRPPQFKPRNCGYDCGYGCQKDDNDEGGGAESDEETAIGDENVHSIAEAQDEDGGESEGLSASRASLPSSSTAVSDYTSRELSSSSSSSSSQELDEMSASMVVEPVSSGDRSPMVPSSGSARSMSPNPGVRYWISSMRVASPLPMRYYFLQTPLRLSPQWEHCRGDPASHLVVPDRSRLWYMMEELAREYGPAYRSSSPPSFGAC